MAPSKKKGSKAKSKSPTKAVASLSLEDKKIPLARVDKAAKLAPGKVGREVQLLTNAFKVVVKETDAFKYAILSVMSRKIQNEAGQGDAQAIWKDVTAKKVRNILFKEMLIRSTSFTGKKVVYDGMNSFYTIGSSLPVQEEVLQFNYSVEGEMEKEFKIEFKAAMDANSGQQLVIDLKNQTDSEAISVKQLCLKHLLEKQPNVVSRGSCQLKTTNAMPLGKNQELLKGMHASIRVGSDSHSNAMTMLVSDVAAGVYERGGPMVDVIQRITGRHVSEIRLQEYNVNLLKELKGLKVEFTGNGFQRKLRIDGMTVTDVTKTFFKYKDKDISVYEYFLNERTPKLQLKHKNLNCFSTKRQDGTFSYTPVEICTLLPNQHHDKKLTLEIQSKVTQETVMDPQKRFDKIEREVTNVSSKKNDLLDMKVSAVPIETTGRVLDPPTVMFKAAERVNQVPANPRFQNPCDFGGKFSKLNQPVPIKKWKVVQFEYRTGQVHSQVRAFVSGLQRRGRELGMDINDPMSVNLIVLPSEQRPYDFLSQGLRKVSEAVNGASNEKGLLLCVLPNKDDLYKDIKYVCNEIGLISQCVILPNLTKKFPDGGFKRLDTMVDNVIKKMNAKLGGINATLESSTTLKAFPPNTMICGMDVYHPGVGETNSASIVGILASYSKDFSKYFSCAKAQPQEAGSFKRKEEVESGLDVIMKDFFTKYKEKNGEFPSNLLFYRDGVSDGQLDRVMAFEVNQILAAMDLLKFRAKIAFITVQKRHPIRLFQFKILNGKYIVSNPLPGTVVDKDIVNPNWNEYYLNSHHALKGTAKPSQYKLIVNEIPRMDNDRIQVISYYLCYIYQRCYKPISIATPARYAHLVAEKAAGLLEAAVRNNTVGQRSVDEVIRTHPDFSEKLVFQ